MENGNDQVEKDNSICGRDGFSLLGNDRLISEINLIIETIADRRSIPALINLLDDNVFEIRWIAAEGLIRIGRRSIIPLLRSIREGKSSCSPGMGAYHVLQFLLSGSEKKALNHLMVNSEKDLKRASLELMDNPGFKN